MSNKKPEYEELKRFSIGLPKYLYEWISRESKRKDRSMGYLITLHLQRAYVAAGQKFPAEVEMLDFDD